MENTYILHSFREQKQMKTYVLDRDWRGGYVVIADSMDQAIKMISERANIAVNFVENFIIEVDTFYEFLGDR